MTKTQVQQMILLALVLFAVLWFVFRKGEPSAPVPATEPGRVVVLPPRLDPRADSAAPGGEPAAIVQAPIVAGPPLARDIFQVPTELLDRIRQREGERWIPEDRRRPAEPIREVIPLQETNLAAELELQGIFWGVPRPQALINRQILSVGDKIRDAEVLSISKEGVILSFAGQRIELKSPPAIRPNEEQQRSGPSQGRSRSTFNP